MHLTTSRPRLHRVAIVEPLEKRRLLSASLVASFAPLPARLPLGGHAAVTVRVRNLGTRARGTVALDVYLSSDSSLDSGDPILVTRAPRSIVLGAHAAHNFSIRLTPPPATSVGGYFLFAVAKPGNGFALGSAASSVAISQGRLLVAHVPHRGHGSGGGSSLYSGSGFYDGSDFLGDDSSYDDSNSSAPTTDPSGPTDSSGSSGDDFSDGDSSYDSGGEDF